MLCSNRSVQRQRVDPGHRQVRYEPEDDEHGEREEQLLRGYPAASGRRCRLQELRRCAGRCLRPSCCRHYRSPLPPPPSVAGGVSAFASAFGSLALFALRLLDLHYSLVKLHDRPARSLDLLLGGQGESVRGYVQGCGRSRPWPGPSQACGGCVACRFSMRSSGVTSVPASKRSRSAQVDGRDTRRGTGCGTPSYAAGFRSSRVWPPSKKRRGLLPARAFWPFRPRPEYVPCRWRFRGPRASWHVSSHGRFKLMGLH